MKKNFILFALMLFLPILVFAQSVTLNLTGSNPVTYNGQNQRPRYSITTNNGGYSDGLLATIQWRDAQYTYAYSSDGDSYGNSQNLTNSTRFVNAGYYKITVTREYRTRRNITSSWSSYRTVSDTKTFTINKVNLNNGTLELAGVTNAQYNGKAWYPSSIDIILNASTFETLDYQNVRGVAPYTGDNTTVTVSDDNINAGWVEVTVTGINNYEGSITSGFSIATRSIAGLVSFVNGTPDYTYNGKNQIPAIVVKDNIDGVETPLVENEDFTVVRPTEAINAGDYTITVTGMGNYNTYNEVEETAGQNPDQEATPVTEELTYTIKKKPLTGLLVINGEATSAGMPSFTYDAEIHPSAEEFTVSDEQEIDGRIVDIITEDDYTAPEATAKAAGSYQYTITATEDGNYTGEATVPFLIGRNHIVINAAQIWKWYGEKDEEAKTTLTSQPAAVEDGCGWVDFTIDSNSSTLAIQPAEKAHILKYLTFARANGDNGEEEGSHDYMIVAKPDMEGCNYAIQIQHNTSKLVIQPAKLTVHVANSSKIFGENNPSYIADKTGANGVIVDYFTITNAAGEEITTNDVPAGQPRKDAKDYVDQTKSLKDVLNIGRKTGEDVGEYEFTYDNHNYDVTFEPAVFTIYNQNNPNGEFAFANGGVYTYNGKAQTPAFTLKINGVQVKADEIQTVTYANNTHVAYRNGNIIAGASCTVTFNPEKSNYQGSVTGYFKIVKADLKARPQDQSHANDGTELTSFPIVYTTFQSNEAGVQETAETALNFVEPTVTKVLQTQSPQGKIYQLVISGGRANDYNLILDNAIYSIGRAVLTVTIDATKVYGQNDPAINLGTNADGTNGALKVTGWVNNETREQKETILKLGKSSYVFEFEREEGEDVGNYAYTFTETPGDINENYTLSYEIGNLQITKKELKVTTQNAEKVYGDPDPEFTAVVTGFEFDDDESVLDIPFWGRAYTLSRDPETEYATTTTATYDNRPVIKGADNVVTWWFWGDHTQNVADFVTNYTLTYVNSGKLTIKKAHLIIEPDDEKNTKVYGDAEPVYAAKVTGLKNGDKAEDVLKKANGKWIYKITRADATNQNAGTYALTIADNLEGTEKSPFVLANYTYEYKNGHNFVISQFPLAVVAYGQSKKYAEAIDPYAMYINDQLVNGESVLANGDKVKDVIYLTTECTKVGRNDNAYEYHFTTGKGKNYKIATDEEGRLLWTNGYLLISPLETIPLGEAALAQLLGKKTEEWPVSQVLKDHDDVIVNVKLADRGMYYDQWYGLVLPFDTKVSALSKKLDYAVVNTLNPNSDGYANGFNFEIAMGEIKANTPFLVKIADETKKGVDVAEVTFEKVRIQYAEEPKATDKSGDFQIVGTWDSFVGPEGNCIVIRHSSKGPRTETFDNATADTKVRETEAYLRLPAGANPANVRILVQEADGTMTAINGVAEAEAEVAEGWYTINGVKLEGEPTVSGTYIFNGKKVFIQK